MSRSLSIFSAAVSNSSSAAGFGGGDVRVSAVVVFAT